MVWQEKRECAVARDFEKKLKGRRGGSEADDHSEHVVPTLRELLSTLIEPLRV